MEELFSSSDMALNLGISLATFYKIRCKRKILPIRRDRRTNVNFYSMEQFEPEMKRYYPLKTTVTFYIYESKINKQ